MHFSFIEPYCLVLLRAHRFVFFRGHPAPTAWTDHNWLFWTRGLVGLKHERRPSATLLASAPLAQL
jgi:hypothetical protein